MQYGLCYPVCSFDVVANSIHHTIVCRCVVAAAAVGVVVAGVVLVAGAVVVVPPVIVLVAAVVVVCLSCHPNFSPSLLVIKPILSMTPNRQKETGGGIFF